MSIAVIFDFSDQDLDLYDRVCEKVGPSIFEAAGLHSHTCVQDGTGFRVIDVWEDEASFAAFGEQVILPALASFGVEGPQPEILPVHYEPGGDNVATVGAIYAAFGQGDVLGILDRLADDVSWEDGSSGDHGLPWLRVGRGKAHVASFFESLAGLQITTFVPTSIVAHGADKVVALIDIEATIVATGKGFADLEIHVWSFAPDGQVTAFRHMVDTAAQVEAATA